MADEKDLARLQGLVAWNDWRVENPERYVDLRGAFLVGADLRWVDLHGADLSGADLRGASLFEADLRGADLRGAKLSEADLSGADLRGADLRGADLIKANLRWAKLSEANLGGANLGGANLGGANLVGADLREVDFRVADLSWALLRGADLERANLGGADLSGADLGGADLERANLREANLREANLERANLREANLERANLREANLERANLSEVNLERATLEKANLKGVVRNLPRDGEPRDGEPPWNWPHLPGVDADLAVVVDTSERIHHGGDKRDTENALPTPVHKVCFTAFHPKEIRPEIWYTLLVYVHVLEMQSMVEADAKQRLEVPHGRRTAKATRSVTRGAEIIVAPELPGCRFNPKFTRLLWLEDWHRVEFRLQAQTKFAGFEMGTPVNGRVAFYVESVLVGEVPICTCISEEADTTTADAPASSASANPYEAIFVSYAHEDSAVVNRLGRAYKALGMEFLRDVEKLRSGEKWSPALLALIERADLFQLYWSRAAKRSRNVTAEWRHALKQKRDGFIRPLYWQVPMPPPPRVLAQLHFSYLDLEQPFP